ALKDYIHFTDCSTISGNTGTSSSCLALPGAPGLADMAVTVTNLVNVANGQASDYLVAYSQTAGGPLAPVRQNLDPRASVLATCVNSTGQTSTACTSLYEATHSAQNTLAAAFTVAKNPEANANALAIYNLIPGTPIFTP